MQRQTRIPRYQDDTFPWQFDYLISVHAPQELKTTFALDLQPTAVINQIARDDLEKSSNFPTVVAQTRRGEKKSATAQSFFFRWRLQRTSRISRVNQSLADAQSRVTRDRMKKNKISGIFGRARICLDVNGRKMRLLTEGERKIGGNSSIYIGSRA